MIINLPHFAHTEPQRRKTRFGYKELSENRLIGESQLGSNLLDLSVRTLQLPPGFGTDQLRDMETHRITGQPFHDPRQLGRRDVKSVCIKLQVVMVFVVLDQQFFEESEDLVTSLDIDRRMAVVQTKNFGTLEQQEFTQVTHNTIPIELVFGQLFGKQRKSTLQIFSLSIGQMQNRQPVCTQESSELAIQRLPVGKSVKILRDKTHTRETCKGRCVMNPTNHTGSQDHQIIRTEGVIMICNRRTQRSLRNQHE